jgi:hypothetical protein
MLLFNDCCKAVGCAAALAELPPLFLKHRLHITGNDIACKRISCKPQKLQAISATVKIAAALGDRSCNQPEEWLPCHGPIVEQSWIGRKIGTDGGRPCACRYS